MTEVIAVHLEDENQGEAGINEVKLAGGSTKSVSQVVREIDGNAQSFYYTLENKKADIVSVKNSGDSGKHIRTSQDDETGNNLLELERY
ncbi:DUF3892 domain-containing protein [Sinobaca sp. H24]|uniref:DUF3892 domain-containing protein n=1 Tax=Sinobaca sp. H24 TaxID=2923376 RepID=UPI0020791F29|nr:DUF3892 domain-containing protein [Sinobaca sp. H24]